jgi:hypothetical protein
MAKLCAAHVRKVCAESALAKICAPTVLLQIFMLLLASTLSWGEQESSSVFSVRTASTHTWPSLHTPLVPASNR